MTRARHVRAGRSIALATALCGAGCYAGLGAGGGGADGADDGGPGGSADDGGSGGGTDGDPSAVCNDDIPKALPTPLRRLSPRQYQNTIRDLFGDDAFVPTYDDLEIIATERGVRQLRGDAEAVLARREAWTKPVFPCDTAGATDDACAQDFITSFGRRAFRRPLSDDEIATLTGVYQAARDELGFADAMDVTLATILQAPATLYLTEFGDPVEGAPDNIRQLTDHELASRLSYFLWDTMPDDELFAAAEAGELRGGGLAEQTERMLADPRAEGKVQDFVWDWMQLAGGTLHFPLEETLKDPELFPDYGPALQEAMRTEFEAFVRSVYFSDEPASFERLFTDNRAYVNASMAALYGVSGPADDATWDWVDLKPEQRAGVLTRAAFLTVFSAANVQSPIRRGVYVIEQALCTDLGTPPPNANNVPVGGGDGVDDNGNPVTRTVREDVEYRTSAPTCASCHNTINPAGFAFENYDPIGRWQTEEIATGLPIDGSGELRGTDVDGPVANAVELSQHLTQSRKAHDCYADRWLFAATGAPATNIDPCIHDAILESFATTGDMRKLLVAIVSSETFRYINTAGQ